MNIKPLLAADEEHAFYTQVAKLLQPAKAFHQQVGQTFSGSEEKRQLPVNLLDAYQTLEALIPAHNQPASDMPTTSLEKDRLRASRIESCYAKVAEVIGFVRSIYEASDAMVPGFNERLAKPFGAVTEAEYGINTSYETLRPRVRTAIEMPSESRIYQRVISRWGSLWGAIMVGSGIAAAAASGNYITKNPNPGDTGMSSACPYRGLIKVDRPNPGDTEEEKIKHLLNHIALDGITGSCGLGLGLALIAQMGAVRMTTCAARKSLLLKNQNRASQLPAPQRTSHLAKVDIRRK